MKTTSLCMILIGTVLVLSQTSTHAKPWCNVLGYNLCQKAPRSAPAAVPTPATPTQPPVQTDAQDCYQNCMNQTLGGVKPSDMECRGLCVS